MRKFITKVDGAELDIEYTFECFENTEPINIGDDYLFFFAGTAATCKCSSENEMAEINPNDRKSTGFGDLVTGFWRNCYKIKTTNFQIDE